MGPGRNLGNVFGYVKEGRMVRLNVLEKSSYTDICYYLNPFRTDMPSYVHIEQNIIKSYYNWNNGGTKSKNEKNTILLL